MSLTCLCVQQPNQRDIVVAMCVFGSELGPDVAGMLVCAAAQVWSESRRRRSCRWHACVRSSSGLVRISAHMSLACFVCNAFGQEFPPRCRWHACVSSRLLNTNNLSVTVTVAVELCMLQLYMLQMHGTTVHEHVNDIATVIMTRHHDVTLCCMYVSHVATSLFCTMTLFTFMLQWPFEIALALVLIKNHNHNSATSNLICKVKQ